MTAEPFYGPIELVGRGHILALAHTPLATVHLRQTMEGINLVWCHFVEEAVLHHHAGAARIFLLAGLENKHKATAYMLLQLQQYLDGTKERAGVHVVPTSMHHAGLLAGEGQPRAFCYGQGVIVGAKRHTVAVWLAATQHRHNAGLADTCLRLQAHLT